MREEKNERILQGSSTYDDDDDDDGDFACGCKLKNRSWEKYGKGSSSKNLSLCVANLYDRRLPRRTSAFDFRRSYSKKNITPRIVFADVNEAVTVTLSNLLTKPENLETAILRRRGVAMRIGFAKDEKRGLDIYHDCTHVFHFTANKSLEKIKERFNDDNKNEDDYVKENDKTDYNDKETMKMMTYGKKERKTREEKEHRGYIFEARADVMWVMHNEDFAHSSHHRLVLVELEKERFLSGFMA
ncbi:hypothetical protein V1477_020729 [Vespula maculifrons]|uniref:Uncharacterized protein n=1 Tax=Vespula maculifrons TaxID=7453 RepID=A0ABD2AMS4_VESMC